MIAGAILVAVASLVVAAVAVTGGGSPAVSPASSPGSPGSSASAAPATSPGAASLPGLDVGAPPWPPETAHLQERLAAMGLPALSAEGTALHTHEHLDVIIDGAPLTVPADIGISQAQGFLSQIHTHDDTGIIHVESAEIRPFTLGQFFDIWGVRFTDVCLGTACTSGDRTLAVFVNGTRMTGDIRAVPLQDHDEIVVAVGTTAQLAQGVPSMYAWPPGL